MRITIEATDDVEELTRAREFIEAMLAPRTALRVVAKDEPIDALNVTIRSLNLLRDAGISTIAELCGYTRHDLVILPNVGPRTMHDVEAALAARGLTLADEAGDDHE